LQETEEASNSTSGEGFVLPPHPPDPRRSAPHPLLLKALLNPKSRDDPPTSTPTAPAQPPRAPPPIAPPAPLRFDQPGPLASASQRRSWARILPPRLWTLGFAEQALAGLLDALPPALCAVLEASAPRLEAAALAAQARRAALSASEAVTKAAAEGRGDADGDGGLGSEGLCGVAFLECLEDIWERDGEEGFAEFAFDPHTQQRANAMLSSRAAAVAAGLGKEELLARLAKHDAPLPSLPLDFLCALLHRALLAAVPLARGGGSVDVMHLRLARAAWEAGSGRGGAALVRVETWTEYDADGRVTQVFDSISIIVPNERWRRQGHR
jgi:hypothetical protein